VPSSVGWTSRSTRTLNSGWLKLAGDFVVPSCD